MKIQSVSLPKIFEWGLRCKECGYEFWKGKYEPEHMIGGYNIFQGFYGNFGRGNERERGRGYKEEYWIWKEEREGMTPIGPMKWKEGYYKEGRWICNDADSCPKCGIHGEGSKDPHSLE